MFFFSVPFNKSRARLLRHGMKDNDLNNHWIVTGLNCAPPKTGFGVEIQLEI